MTRLELAGALGAAILAAALIGWGLRWAWERVKDGGPADRARLDALSARLADVEAERDALVEASAAREADLTERLRETEGRLRRTLAEREAELSAVMETVGSLRREIAQRREERRADRD